jgi:hypothetical protein
MSAEAAVGSIFLWFFGMIIFLVLLRLVFDVSEFMKYQKIQMLIQVKQLQQSGVTDSEIKTMLIMVWGKVPKELAQKLK